MDDTFLALNTVNHRFTGGNNGEHEDEEIEEECCDTEAWETLSKSFKEVQSVLDHTRHLIEQVNDNHRSKIPRNLAKNVELIHKINGNISRVIDLYSNLSANFCEIAQHRRANKSTNDAVISKN